uniref:Putative secreted protein n=1 Tax=Anopheles marajoara TaxID=58244 RepID=A0A2M4CC56_9DIPT
MWPTIFVCFCVCFVPSLNGDRSEISLVTDIRLLTLFRAGIEGIAKLAHHLCAAGDGCPAATKIGHSAARFEAIGEEFD